MQQKFLCVRVVGFTTHLFGSMFLRMGTNVCVCVCHTNHDRPHAFNRVTILQTETFFHSDFVPVEIHTKLVSLKTDSDET